MSHDLLFNLIGLTFILPPLIAALWLVKAENKFFALLRKKKVDTTTPEISELLTKPQNIFSDYSNIRRMYRLIWIDFKDKDLQIAVKNVRARVYTIIGVAVISFTIAIMLLTLGGF